MNVATPATPASRDDDALARGVNVEERFVRIRVEALGADRHGEHQVLAALAVLVLPATVLAALGLELVRESHVKQGGLAVVTDEDDVPPLPAVSTGWPE